MLTGRSASSRLRRSLTSTLLLSRWCAVTSCTASSLPPSAAPAAARLAATTQLIASPSNARLKLLRKLHARRGRERTGLVVVEGQRLLLDALDALQPDAFEFVLLSDEWADADALEALVTRLEPSQLLRAPAKMVAEVSDTQTPQGCLGVLRQPELEMPTEPDLVLVLDRLQDPGNLGTLLRSAAGAGVAAGVLLPGCCDPWGLKALRAGMGAQLRMPLKTVEGWEEAAAQLDGWGCQLLAADAGGQISHSEVDWRRPSALIVGSEANGLSEELRGDPRLSLCQIPLEGRVESLNAAVAGSVILYEAARQRAG